MEKFRVQNFIVSDLEKFEDALAICLIRNQIDYVQIDNEFHFLDKIYRFYEVTCVEKGDDIYATIFDGCNEPMFSPMNGALSSLLTHLNDAEEKQESEVAPKPKAPIYKKSMMKRDNVRFNGKHKLY